MKKVAMIEYQGRVDENDKALGHGPKVLNEYFDFIKEYCQVSVYAPREVLNEFNSRREAVAVKILPEKIVMGQDKSIFVKIKNKFGMFKNIRLALNNTDAETVWFFNTEYYLFLYLFLHKRINKKVVCTMFLDGYHGGFVAKVKQFIFEKAQKKIDLIISTGNQLKFKNCDYKYVPDYYYDKDKYIKTDVNAKKQEAVCLGTMGKGKMLKEMIEAFNRSGYPLTIAGRFYDKDQYNELTKMANDNITIVDRYLTDEEYTKMLSEAKYTILPYGKDKYNRQTSGVMQEAMFLNTIPVSYNAVLDGNLVPGIGFEEWEELDLYKVTDSKTDEIIKEYERMKENEYSKSSVGAFYKSIFE